MEKNTEKIEEVWLQFCELYEKAQTFRKTDNCGQMLIKADKKYNELLDIINHPSDLLAKASPKKSRVKKASMSSKSEILEDVQVLLDKKKTK